MSLLPTLPPAILALADGTIFRGLAIGAGGRTSGEVVFNTAMTGYQEILTDPSYCRQIVTLTYPHIGNVGCNDEDFESCGNHAAGLVIRDLPVRAESWRLQETLPDYLQKHGLVAIAGVDTRKLTRILREKGAQAGCIMAGEIDEEQAVAEARAFPGLAGMDLARVVSVAEPYEWTAGQWSLDGYRSVPTPHWHVVAYDFGVKHNILRMLAARGCKITVVPAQTSASEVLKLKPDGVFLSNGPGDPEPCDYAITAIREILAHGVPTFGICLGHQLLALASGARTMKGSAPDIAGKGLANPLAAFLTLAMLYDHLGEGRAAERLRSAVEHVVLAGQVTRDVGGTLSTAECGDAVLRVLTSPTSN